MGDKAAEVPSYDAMPSRALSLVELANSISIGRVIMRQDLSKAGRSRTVLLIC